jgi:two-component system, OmpR family, KDP operon response regulator KdpE
MTAAAEPKVLVIDDEPQIHRFLGPALEAAGYRPLRAETAAAGLRLAAEQRPSVIVLDLGLPDQDGQAVIPRLRALGSAPILVLSARDRESEKVMALDSGAEDYVEKPFAMGEFLARLRVLLRRSSEEGRPPPPRLQVGPLRIDFPRRIARLDGQDEPLHLTPREWDLLVVLSRARGRVMTHRQLLTMVWGPAHTGDSQYLRVYVGHLRQKLGEAAGLLRTEPGIGYRFGDGEEMSDASGEG